MVESRVYKRTAQTSLCADIYYHGEQTPVLIYIHGGGLIFGSRQQLPTERVDIYKQAGFSVISIDYRLAPETKLPAIAADIQDALHWVRTEASRLYDFNTDKIALVGNSAGGYLSLLMGTMNERPDAIVSFYGYGDILGAWYAEPSEFYRRRPIVRLDEVEKLLHKGEVTEGGRERFDYYLWCRQHGTWVESVTGLNRDKDVELLRMYNPIDNIMPGFPPTLLLHGDEDTDVPYEQSVMMHGALREAGVQAELVTMKGAGHGFDRNMQAPGVRQAYEKTVAFLKKHLNG